MAVVLRGAVIFTLLLMASLWGCSTVTSAPAPSSFSTPLFTPTTEDAKQVALLAHELDTQALHCLELSACERVHFARALVSLFENQEAARASFRQVIEHNPVSPLAASSQLWLQLMESEEMALRNRECPPAMQLVAQYVREWMERQIMELVTVDKRTAVLAASADPQFEQGRVLHVLHKQLRERDRKIAELRAQLEALKVIDDDHNSKFRMVKPPASLRAAEVQVPK